MSAEPRRKTKIVATLGPASASHTVITELIEAGVNVFRLNLSHGSLEEHSASVETIRSCSETGGLAPGILLDLQGPRIRTGRIRDGLVELKTNSKVHVTTEDIEGTEELVPILYPELTDEIKAGDRILINDGLIELKVVKNCKDGIEAIVLYGGELKNSKGVNLPGVKLGVPSLTERDLEGVEFAVKNKIDFVALSFVRGADDIEELKSLLEKKGSKIPVIAKIENAHAVEDLGAILEASGGVMIARGDLGVELATEEVPILQKEIIRLANDAGKPVITATQMLESMISSARPTRAEATDVANAVFDGTDAVMLSGETAVGKHPVRAVETMARIVKKAEGALKSREFLRRNLTKRTTFAEAVTFAAVAAAGEVNAKAIMVFTESGETGRMLSKLRPCAPVYAFTPTEEAGRSLTLSWGVEPFAIKLGEDTDEMICRGEAHLLNLGIAQWSDTVVIVSGTKIGVRGATNMMKIDWIGSEECRLFLKDS